MALLSPIFRMRIWVYRDQANDHECDDEEPTAATLGDIYARVATKPRLARAVHEQQPAQVLDKG